MKTIGIVPARMGSSRFPGKPLFPICGKPMVEHVFARAKLSWDWDELCIATCDAEIRDFAEDRGFPVVMTADTHTRALDRVAEAYEVISDTTDDHDIVVCVQGDEPLLAGDTISAVINPFHEDDTVEGTMLAVPITDEALFRNPDIVKIVHDVRGNVLYTSRQPIPHCETFSADLGAKRVGGIFGFRWHFLKWFTALQESPLEQAESCDSNRICDNGRFQRLAPIAARPYYSVDSPEDVKLVEDAITEDPLWGQY
ncbi:MAG: 3-deoxy-manno-octulosonate cytidylyltransferase [Rhodospirillaceae bacterium]|jgi:3-deoxy-manno-octulosonate cytidylyltransferase (CMP-KDO synthetase)|nr:3-deoxy-manno-octulosonate cytidylyltransferase [Rhodospirillaceae bacterium]